MGLSKLYIVTMEQSISKALFEVEMVLQCTETKQKLKMQQDYPISAENIQQM